MPMDIRAVLDEPSETCDNADSEEDDRGGEERYAFCVLPFGEEPSLESLKPLPGHKLYLSPD